MKLLIVTQIVDKNDDVLGAFHQWIKRFSEVFDSVEVICLKRGETDLPANVRVHSLGKEENPPRHGTWAKIITRLRYLWRFYKYVFRLRKSYDAVFAHMNPEYVLLGGPLWRLWGKVTFLWYAHKKGSWLRLIALRIAHRVVSVSKESFAGSDSPKFIGVGHGIDPDLYACPTHTASRDQKVILSVGRITPVKEYDLLIEACRILRDTYKRTDFLVQLVGGPSNADDSAYEDGLKSKIATYGLTKAFEFVGPVPNKDLLPYLCPAAAFVSMQRIGGAGKSFLEAMSCGVPTIVSTPVFNPYLGEWLTHLFYDWTPEDFAAKLNACLSLSNEERARMSEALRGIVVEHHNLKKLVRRLREEYELVRARR